MPLDPSTLETLRALEKQATFKKLLTGQIEYFEALRDEFKTTPHGLSAVAAAGALRYALKTYEAIDAKPLSESIAEIRAAIFKARPDLPDLPTEELIHLLFDAATPTPTPTCATCVHHNDSGPLCKRGVDRPNSIVPELRVSRDTFGCSLHQASSL